MTTLVAALSPRRSVGGADSQRSIAVAVLFDDGLL
jgi:hypothetical protein